MSLLVATQVTAIATAALAAFAIVTAVLAGLAFRKQSAEVRDQQKLIVQQSRLLEVQAGQLDVERQQLEDQRKINEKQTEVAELQVQELRESLDERKRDAAARRGAQASRVFLTQTRMLPLEIVDEEGVSRSEPPILAALIENASDQPVYNVEVLWRRGSASLGEPNPEPLSTIMPGRTERTERQFPEDTNFDVSGAMVRFTDAGGVRWLRRPDGHLHEDA